MSEIKSRVKVEVKGFGLNHRCTVLGQVKIGFFYETVYQRQMSNTTNMDETIALAKEAIARYKAAGFDEQGVIEL